MLWLQAKRGFKLLKRGQGGKKTGKAERDATRLAKADAISYINMQFLGPAPDTEIEPDPETVR